MIESMRFGHGGAREAVARRLEPFKAAIDAMLIGDTTAPRKQRHTARRILARLIEEHGAEELSYSTVRDYVRVRRAQVDVEAGRRMEVFVPQEHAPGTEAEVDFGEVWVVLNGVKTKCHMFIFRLSHSGKAIHRIYPTQAQEAFLEGHIEAFQVLGGIPTKHIRYDNLTSAVTAVVFGQGRQRQENDRWVLFRSHYGFDPFYCQPGIAGAHEKGGVEGEVGWFRRNRLSPMPVAESLDELNDRIRIWEAQDDGRRINDRIRSIGQDLVAEQPFLAPLPAEAFDPGLVLTPRVDRSSMITVRMVKYSVPARFIGRTVRVSLRASEVVVFDGRTVVARHQRIVAKCGQSVQLDHYLEVLKTKPGALPGSTALARARESGAFNSAYEAFWAASRRVNGDADGTRELIDVLLLHRTMDASDVTAGIVSALGVGAVSADVVAVEARRHASNIPRVGSARTVIPVLTMKRMCNGLSVLPSAGSWIPQRSSPGSRPIHGPCHRSMPMTSCWPNAPNTPQESRPRRTSHEPHRTGHHHHPDPAPAARPDRTSRRRGRGPGLPPAPPAYDPGRAR